jgi:hypothetical protein
MSSKLMELLKEIAPATNRVALMFNPETAPAGGSYFLRPVEAAAPALKVKVVPAPVHNAGEIDSAITAFAHEPGGAGLIVMPDVFLLAHREQILALAEQHRLPAAYAYRFFAVSGGLNRMGRTSLICFAARRLTSIASSKAPSRRNCRSNSRPSSSS